MLGALFKSTGMMLSNFPAGVGYTEENDYLRHAYEIL